MKDSLSLDSRFDLAYNAAHAFSLAALRWHGYRSEHRYTVFQCLGESHGIPAPTLPAEPRDVVHASFFNDEKPAGGRR